MVNALPLRRRTLLTNALAGMTALPGIVHAQSGSWPNKPLRLVITQAPGSGSDILGRLVAEKLREQLSQNVLVENKVGASGLIGHQHVLASPRDGYTLLISSTANLLITPLMSSKSGFRHTDFTPVAPLIRTPYVVVTANAPGKPATFKALVENIQQSAVTFASVGSGSIGHLAAELIVERSGTRHKAINVPYRGSAQALGDVVGGQGLFAVDSIGAALPLIKSGRLRALAVTSANRLAGLPQVPTVAESAFAGFEMVTHAGIFVANTVPREAVQRMGQAGAALLKDPGLRERLLAMESEPMEISAEEYAQSIAREAPLYERLVQQLGLRLD